MTTIAVRGRVMAADSQLSDAWMYSVGAKKIFRKSVTKPGGRRRYDCLIGVCGVYSVALAFVDWFPGVLHLTTGRDVPTLPKLLEKFEHEFSALIVDPSGLYQVDEYLRPFPVSRKYAAIGSGGALATMAMDLGCSAEKAVIKACEHDLYSRPPVTVERL